MRHVIDWIKARQMSPAIKDEQKCEHGHLLVNAAIDLYRNMKGAEQIKCVVRHALSMRKYC